ncbi:Crp/Fnr family transcriptional regulator [Flavonifractor hominis]|uniref:Crp/Fnr family transcriptional regulator n=1 Tax=Flavonifractor hominis TaxID=3133178 RepID=A0ABV1EMH4_9FIRM
MRAEEFYQQFFQLSDPVELQRLMEITELQHLRKGELVCREGERRSKVTFLLHGLLRGYFLDANGRDITDCFAFQCGAPAMACLALGEPSSITIEAIAESDVLNLPIQAVLDLLEQRPEHYRVYSEFLLKALRTHWEVKTIMYQYPALQRYQWFLRAYPGLSEQVSGKHIASFLGMTQVTLSRLRRTLREEQQEQKDE